MEEYDSGNVTFPGLKFQKKFQGSGMLSQQLTIEFILEQKLEKYEVGCIHNHASTKAIEVDG